MAEVLPKRRSVRSVTIVNYNMCAHPRSLSCARLAVNAVSTLLGVLAAKERQELLAPTLPALVRICRAFPPLIEDCLQVNRIGGKIVHDVYFLFPSCCPSQPVCTAQDRRSQDTMFPTINQVLSRWVALLVYVSSAAFACCCHCSLLQ